MASDNTMIENVRISYRHNGRLVTARADLYAMINEGAPRSVPLQVFDHSEPASLQEGDEISDFSLSLLQQPQRLDGGPPIHEEPWTAQRLRVASNKDMLNGTHCLSLEEVTK